MYTMLFHFNKLLYNTLNYLYEINSSAFHLNLLDGKDFHSQKVIDYNKIKNLTLLKLIDANDKIILSWNLR